VSGFKINKQKCIGCQACVQACPGAIKIGKDGKAEIIDQKKLEQCGGERICSMGAIERIDGREKLGTEDLFPHQPPPFGGRGMGRGMGAGRGRGLGRGLGRGPRDGRGQGRGGGGRR